MRRLMGAPYGTGGFSISPGIKSGGPTIQQPAGAGSGSSARIFPPGITSLRSPMTNVT